MKQYIIVFWPWPLLAQIWIKEGSDIFFILTKWTNTSIIVVVTRVLIISLLFCYLCLRKYEKMEIYKMEESARCLEKGSMCTYIEIIMDDFVKDLYKNCHLLP